MSYCRFSDDDFQCDVYCYESVYGGFVIHVASKKLDFKEPLPEKIRYTDDDCQKWIERHKNLMDIVKSTETVDIGLPYDGETFVADDAESAGNKLKEIKEAGYRVPDIAINNLLAESRRQKITDSEND